MEYRRGKSGLFLSALTAGLETGFSILLMGLFYTTFVENVNADTLNFIVSLGYPLGFIFVIIGRSHSEIWSPDLVFLFPTISKVKYSLVSSISI
jgi:formate/nitrite transporter FocA (FNT family)